MIVFVLAIFDSVEEAEEFADELDEDTPYQIVAFDSEEQTVQ